MTSWPQDLAKGVRQALGTPGAVPLRELLISALAAGESGAVFRATEAGVSLVVGVPSEAPFHASPVVELARRAGRGDVTGPVAPAPPLTAEWPAGLAFAIPSATGTRGVLVLLGPALGGVSAETQARAPVLVALLALILELDLLGGHARTAESRVGLFRQLLRLAKAGRDIQQIGEEILALAADLVAGDVGGLWLREHRAGALYLRATRGPFGGRGPRRVLRRSEVEPVLGLAPLRCPPRSLALPRDVFFREADLTAAVVVPLTQDDEPVGLLAVGRLGAKRPFEEGEAELVVQLAGLATVPLLNVALRSDLRERTRQLRAGRRIGRAVSACLSLDELFRVATRELRRIIAFDTAAIVVLEEHGEDGRVLAGQPGLLPRALAWSPEFARTVTGEVIRARRAVVIPDVAVATAPLLPLLRELPEAHALVSVPLLVDDEAVGALTLLSQARGRFRQRHLRLLAPVAEQLAIAIRHARLLAATTHGLEERLRLEARLARAERYATIGRLAGALAHEIRNPLTVLATTVQYIRDRLPPEDERRVLLDSADRKVREMDESLEGLLSFSRPLELRPRPTALAALLGDLAEFVRVRGGAQGVEVGVYAEPGLRPAMLDPRLIEQALLNLALNALEAMPGGGQLTFGAGQAPGSGNLVVTVADTGPGIEDAHLSAIFEPYFTTKRRGTGLGLAITRRIVEEHGGAIEVASEPGRGTTFVVTLPATGEPSHGSDARPAR